MTTEGSAENEVETELDGDGAANQAGSSQRVYVLVRAPGVLRVIDVPKGSTLSVGRANDSDVVVEDAKASRQHAVIRREKNRLVLRDLGGRNGTRVNGVVLRADERDLAGGDVLSIGRFEIVIATTQASTEPARPEGGIELEDLPDEVIVADPAMVKVFQVAQRLAKTTSTVIILGETGVGKEVIAERIHAWGPRAKAKFLRINCASLPETLLESELFGYERGAFTGAERRKLGYFEAASGGTLLLDEIGELALGMQAKLLRVLESGRIIRVGGTDEIAIDVRILCATHRRLDQEVAAGRFRQDLFYRIGTFVIEMPALRERPSEVTLLTERFVRDFAEKLGIPTPTLEPEASQALLSHRWPGNIRELRNVIEHAVVLADGPTIGVRHLPKSVWRATGAELAGLPHAGVRTQLEEVERKAIEDALIDCEGNRTRAAQKLGISRRAIVYKIAKYEIDR